VVGVREVSDVEGHQLRTADCPGEAHQEQRPVTGAEEIVGVGEHAAEVAGEEGLDLLLCGAQAAADPPQ
jgi:hypothetical protein